MLDVVRAVGGIFTAAPVWLVALEALTAAGAPLQPLLDQLAAACLGQRKGPVRVRVLCQSTRVREHQLMAHASPKLHATAAALSLTLVLSFAAQGGMGSVAAAAVEVVHAVDGIVAARSLWGRLARGPPPGGELFLAAARAEAAAMAACEPGADAAAARSAFEAGFAAYGAEDWQLWLEYVQFAQRQPGGRAPSSGALIQRARKALHDTDVFTAALKHF